MSGLHLEEEFVFRGGRVDLAPFGEEGDLRQRELLRQIGAIKIRVSRWRCCVMICDRIFGGWHLEWRG